MAAHLERVAKELAPYWWQRIRDEGDPFGPSDLERAVAAALAACAREATLEEHDKLCLRCINAKTRPTLAVRCSRGIDLVAERAAGEKAT